MLLQGFSKLKSAMVGSQNTPSLFISIREPDKLDDLHMYGFLLFPLKSMETLKILLTIALFGRNFLTKLTFLRKYIRHDFTK